MDDVAIMRSVCVGSRLELLLQRGMTRLELRAHAMGVKLRVQL